MSVFTSIDKQTKRLSIEKIYQKKSQLEHILLRPDTYIGSVEHTDKSVWVLIGLLFKMILIPSLFKHICIIFSLCGSMTQNWNVLCSVILVMFLAYTKFLTKYSLTRLIINRGIQK